MRLLIVKLGSIGDIVHTLPALAAVRRGLPDARISWAVEEKCAEILRGNPMIDNLIEVDTHSLRGGKVIEEMLIGASKQIRNLRQHKFDVAIDFQGLWKSAMIAKLSAAEKRWGFSRAGLRESGSRILLTNTVDVPPQINVVRKNLALVAGALGVDVPDAPFEFPIATSDEHRDEANAIIGKTDGEKFALLNPGGGWVTKLWHAEKYGELADVISRELAMTPILVTAPREKDLAVRAATASKSGKLVLAEPSLKGLYEIARRASVFVGSDTGPMHIAVAAGAPVVGLFGPTEWWRNGSTNPDDICVERRDINCRVDCHRRTCSKWICMDSDVATVFEAVKTRIQKTEFRNQMQNASS